MTYRIGIITVYGITDTDRIKDAIINRIEETSNPFRRGVKSNRTEMMISTM